ncbi:MAG: DNA repair protein RecO [Oscillospiraceae bacterium]|jgi:DNA repair protein RecO (recombination protein O)|nr:DNA repair protein RecO [Oscillospiraceae bacterium]
MSHIKTEALVLKVSPVGDKDRLLTLLSDECGVIRAFAKGARSLKNKNFAVCTQFVYGSFEIYKSRDYYSVSESSPLQLFEALSGDLSKLSLAQYFCELASLLAPSETYAHDFLRVMRVALYYLSAGEKDARQLKAALEMRLLSMAGYMPDLRMCRECGAYTAPEMRFFHSEGIILCGDCAAAGGVGGATGVNGTSGTGGASVAGGTGGASGRYGQSGGYSSLGEDALSALRYSVYAEQKVLFSFSSSGVALGQFCDAAERYLISKIERVPKTLEFYRNLPEG